MPATGRDGSPVPRRAPAAPRAGLAPPTTIAVPAELFDVYLPILSEAELRVLLVVFRRTHAVPPHPEVEIGWDELANLTGVSATRDLLAAVHGLEQLSLLGCTPSSPPAFAVCYATAEEDD